MHDLENDGPNRHYHGPTLSSDYYSVVHHLQVLQFQRPRSDNNTVIYRKCLQYRMRSMPDCGVIKDVLTAGGGSIITVSRIACTAELLHCLIDSHVVWQNMTVNQQLQMMPCHSLRY